MVDVGAAVDEAQQIESFLDLTRAMLSRSDYLLPLVAGQKQFREDNYNMASAAQLEDLFFDALGMFVRENNPDVVLERRTGRELWDYGVDGLRLSHKESMAAEIAVWWTAGDRDESTGRYRVKPGKERFTAEHPIVLVYSGCSAYSYTTELPVGGLLTASVRAVAGKLEGTLGVRAIAGSSERSRTHGLLLAKQQGTDLVVARAWRPDEWADLTFHDFWPVLGGPGIGDHDLWLDRVYADARRGICVLGESAVGARLHIPPDALLPGIYVIPSAAMRDVPMVANNRAHSFAPEATKALLLDARAAGFYLAFPEWFADFAVAQPPNLYAMQREQYENLFAARRR